MSDEDCRGHLLFQSLAKVEMNPPATMIRQPVKMGHFLPQKSVKYGTMKKLMMEPMLNLV